MRSRHELHLHLQGGLCLGLDDVDVAFPGELKTQLELGTFHPEVVDDSFETLRNDAGHTERLLEGRFRSLDHDIRSSSGPHAAAARRDVYENRTLRFLEPK